MRPALVQGWARYTTVSLRSLAGWRLTVGALALYVVVRRWLTLPLLYSQDGAYPEAALAPSVTWQAGPLRYISSDAGLHLAFALCALIALAVCVGFQTRYVKWLLLPAVWAVNHRTPQLFTGGEVVLQLQCFYLPLLPVAEEWSVDAWRRERKQASASERPRSVTTPFYFVLLLQLAAIYLFNAWSKSGPTWREGTAVARSLGAVTLVSDVGGWVAEWPPALLRVLTYQTLAMEWVLPLLLLCPWWRRWLHLVAAALILALHGGILVMMEVGIFSVAIMAHVPLLVHPRQQGAVARAAPRTARWQAAGAALLVYLLLARLSSDLVLYPNRPRLWLPQPLADLTHGLGLWQPWMMFSPDPPARDLIIVTDAVTASGKHFDPWRRIASDNSEPLKTLPRSSVRSHAYTRYEDALTKLGVHSKLHPTYARWVLRQSLEGDPVERFDAWMLSTSTDVSTIVPEAELEQRVGVLSLPLPGALSVAKLEAVGVWEPGRAIDGKIVPDGTHVFTPVSAAMSAGCPSLTLDLGAPRDVKSAFVQADAADSFLLEGSTDGAVFRAIGEVAPLQARHHRSRVIELSADGVRFVRIRPKRSRGLRHILSELQLFERAITLPNVPLRQSEQFISARERPAVVSILSGANHPSPDCPADAWPKPAAAATATGR